MTDPPIIPLTFSLLCRFHALEPRLFPESSRFGRSPSLPLPFGVGPKSIWPDWAAFLNAVLDRIPEFRRAVLAFLLDGPQDRLGALVILRIFSEPIRPESASFHRAQLNLGR